MRESILTIPISEIFEVKKGCPICRMRDMLETRTLDYIMGAAMMEPDVRLETNRLGFCPEHLFKMEHQKNRLSLALMLQTRLEAIQKTLPKKISAASGTGLFASLKKQPVGKGTSLSRLNTSCFVCNKIDWGMERLLATFFSMAIQQDFNSQLMEQEYICLPHFELLSQLAPEKIPKKNLDRFFNDIRALTSNMLDLLYSDVSHYCSMYDYRNSGKDADWGNSKDAVERAIKFIGANSL